MNMFFNHFESQRTGNTNNQSYNQNMFNASNNQNPASSFNPAGFFSDPKNNVKQNQTRAHAKPKWDTHVGAVNTGYTFTNYSVNNEGFKQASSGLKWNDPTNRVNNNFIEHWDDEYGWVKVVAVNGDLLNEGGKNVWNSDLHNTILEVEYDNGQKFLAGVYDHCGASSDAPKIDVWQYNSTPENFTGKFTVKRKGGKTNFKKY